MKIAYFYMTRQGRVLVNKLSASLPGVIYDKTDYMHGIQTQWDEADALVFVMATGIVVRKIAPFIQAKTTDPAVVVIDQNGRFVISLLSGHLGGANALANQLAAVCGGMAVITTATDVANVPAMDVFAKMNHLKIENINMLKYISSAMVEGQPILLLSESRIDGNFPENVRVVYVNKDRLIDEAILDAVDIKAGVVIADDCDYYEKYFCHTTPVLKLAKRPLVVGTGCRKGVSSEAFSEAFDEFVNTHGIDRTRIGAVTTIELKKDEPCIQALVKQLGAELMIFSADALEKVDMQDSFGHKIETSEFVREVTGVGSVSEASAYLGSDRGKILIGKTKYRQITFALAENKGALKL